MTRQRLVSLIYLGVFLVTITWSARAWSQASSESGSLADRIRNMQRGWNGATPADAGDDSTGSAPVPTDPTVARPNSSIPTAKSGLPQVNAKSLIPMNLFGRPTPGTSSENGDQPSQIRPHATAPKTLPRAINQSGTPQSNARQRLGAVEKPSSTGSSVTPAAPQSTKFATNPSLNHDFGSGIAEPATPAASPVRGSPEPRAPLSFDPEALRNDLAGAFPAPPASGHANSNDDSGEKANSNSKNDRAIGSIGSLSKDQLDRSRREGGYGTQSPIEPPAAETTDSRQPYPTVGSLLGHRSNPSPKPTGGMSGSASETSKTDSKDAGAKAFQSTATPRSSAKSAPLTSSVKSSESAAGHFNGGGKSTASGDDTADAPDALVTNRAPVIVSDIEGPKQITIGREASYHLRLRNDGAVAADDFVASIRIPNGVEVVNSSATRGIVRQPQSGEGKSAGMLEWQIQRLESQAAETLTLRLIPHESRPLELGVTWTHAPVGAHAVVEVQEPLLKMQIAGPDEVLFGKSQTYRLLLTNPGTGIAENVKVDLLPPGAKPGTTTTHRIGDLAPGASKSIEVELTAREAGKLNVKAVASAEGGLRSDATKDLFCRKPELEVDWRGPSSQYAGTAATYFFRVRNPGTATAEDVALHATLPEGAEFVSASDGQSFDSDRGEVQWRIGSLRPGDDCFMELKCTVRTPGENQLHITAATAAGDLTDNKLATTNVVALADLKLDVSDPPGPIPVGDDAVYEIHVINRGNSAAQDVSVVALFSDGLEPEAIDGSQYTVSDGRVSFRSIEKIPAGQNVSLRIHARAMKPGTHVFRAEVLCKDLEIKLAAEETTRFYQDEVTRDGGPNSQPSLGAKHTETVR